MHCKNCGTYYDECDAICPKCGKIVNKDRLFVIDNLETMDYGSIWWSILGLAMPIAGFIVYFCWKNKMPKSAKQAKTGAVVHSFLIFVASVLYFLFVNGVIHI